MADTVNASDIRYQAHPALMPGSGKNSNSLIRTFQERTPEVEVVRPGGWTPGYGEVIDEPQTDQLLGYQIGFAGSP